MNCGCDLIPKSKKLSYCKYYNDVLCYHFRPSKCELHDCETFFEVKD
jgi:hypothetical protein